jgi:hypothetical protein
MSCYRSSEGSGCRWSRLAACNSQELPDGILPHRVCKVGRTIASLAQLTLCNELAKFGACVCRTPWPSKKIACTDPAGTLRTCITYLTAKHPVYARCWLKFPTRASCGVRKKRTNHRPEQHLPDERSPDALRKYLRTQTDQPSWGGPFGST